MKRNDKGEFVYVKPSEDSLVSHYWLPLGGIAIMVGLILLCATHLLTMVCSEQDVEL